MGYIKGKSLLAINDVGSLDIGDTAVVINRNVVF